MTDDAKATCHCGLVEIKLTLPNGVENAGRCSCSICSRKYAAFVGVDLDDLEIVKGEKNLKEFAKAFLVVNDEDSGGVQGHVLSLGRFSARAIMFWNKDNRKLHDQGSARKPSRGR